MSAEATTLPMDSAQPEEFQKEAVPKSDLLSSRFFLEAAALLSLWSALVINEGAIRLINSDPSAGFDDDLRPPRMVMFLGGLFEVFFGLVGLFVGVAAFIFRYYSTTLTKVSIGIQQVFGYFVFLVYVFLIPAYRAADLTEPVLPGLSLGQSRFLAALGILTSFHFCLALQGGQFVFFARLICGGTGRDFLKQRSGNAMRAVFWNMNLALSGLWTLITGILIQANVGSGKLDMAFFSPPNVGRLPGMTIWTGVLMLVYGLIGAVVGKMGRKAPGMYYLMGGYVYISMMLNFGIVQFGLLGGIGAGDVALHNGLVFMTAFLGPYFVYQANKDGEKDI